MGSAPWVGPVVPMATVQENREVYQGASGEFPCSEGGSPTTSSSRTSSDCMVRMWIGCVALSRLTYLMYCVLHSLLEVVCMWGVGCSHLRVM